jgi:multidrug efflux pump subunit AcrB
VAEAMARIDQFLPKGIQYFYHYDSSIFVYQAIQGVVETLLIAFLLVFAVVYLFIQNFRGTIIPILAHSGGRHRGVCRRLMSGFNINTLSLFGLVLAIGIVVDDAIVVLENVERIMEEEKLNSFDATIKAMREVSAPGHRHRPGVERGLLCRSRFWAASAETDDAATRGNHRHFRGDLGFPSR